MNQEVGRTLQAVIDATPISIIRSDPNGHVTLWNKAAERTFGWTEDEVLGEFMPIVPPEGRERFKKRLGLQLGGGSAGEIEIERIRKDGTRFISCLWTAPVIDSSGRANAVIGCIADITERKKNEQELQAAKAEAEQANAAKNEFLAKFSHELRTPLSAILGYNALMADPLLPKEKQISYVDCIRRNVLILRALVEDILDISSIEAKKIHIERHLFSIMALLSDLEAVMKLKANDKGLEFSIDKKNELPQFILSDETRLRQVLLNLTGNAIKFTDQGYVRIEVGHDTHRNQIYFRIIDSGPGILAEQADSIFENFVQGAQNEKTRRQGLGLGLALARQLAQALGGDVTLQVNDKHQGSIFEVRIDSGQQEIHRQGASYIDPQQPGATLSSTPIEQSTPLLGQKILVVEDNDDLRSLITDVLMFAGAEVGQAIDGQDGIEKAEQEDWDLILMDIQMPRLNGYEATSKLRAMGYTNPIVALTANAMHEHNRLSSQAGCDAHIAKPFQIEALLDTIARLRPQDRHGNHRDPQAEA